MEKSLEIAAIQSDKKLIRQSFRLPVKYCKDLSLKINDQSHKIVNIGSKGIAFYLAESTTFKVDPKLHDIVLQLENHTIHAEGQVVHVSAVGNEEICGMKFVAMDKNQEEILDTYIHNTTSSLFNK